MLTLVAGAGPFSLGRRIAERIAARDAEHAAHAVLTLDQHPVAHARPNLRGVCCDLNPLTHPRGFAAWSEELSATLSDPAEGAGGEPVRRIVLCAARFHAGPFEEHSLAARVDVLGLNLCGKFELLDVVMRRNRELGVSNAAELTVCDFGSLQSLRRVAHRGFYTPSKAAGLALCDVLAAGHEVARCLHLALGPADTPMLHASHWTLHEGGDPAVFSTLLRAHPDLYEAVFRRCDRAAFAEALGRMGLAPAAHLLVLERYARRRALTAEGEDGISDPEALGDAICALLDDADAESGIYLLSSPEGRLKQSVLPFASVRTVF